MKVVIVLGLICLFAAMAFAQADFYALVGRVADSAGNPIAGAEVTIRAEGDPTRDQTTKTDANGKYRFSRILGGVFVVSASYVSSGELKVSAPVTTTVRLQSSPTVVDLLIEGAMACVKPLRYRQMPSSLSNRFRKRLT